MARLLLFYNEDTEQEYVVLTEDVETPIEDWCRPDFVLYAEAEVDGDVDKFPTEHELWKRS